MAVPLFVELCAGTAALSLRLHGGRACRPPVSRMGAKTGYADAILEVLGLRPGEGADRYLWCEPDDGARLMLIAYTDAALRREAAAIIRGWADEEPRALWERLRDEGPVTAPREWVGGVGAVDAREVARWQWLVGRSFSGAFGQAYVSTEPEGGKARGLTPEHFAARLGALPDLPAAITSGAVDAREVARWTTTRAWCFRPGEIASGFRDPMGGYSGSAKAGGHACDGLTIAGMAARLDALPDLPAAITSGAVDAREVARWASGLNVSPDAAATNGIDGHGPHSVLLCHELRGRVRRQNVADGLLRQDGAGVLLSDLRRAVPDLVGDVLALGAPCEVCGAVVRAVPVKMADAMPLGPRSVERSGDESGEAGVYTTMRGAHDEFAVPVLVDAPFQWAVGEAGLHAPLGRHEVPRRDADGLPDFHDDSPICTTLLYGGLGFKVPPGTIVFLDPPYRNTTGYLHDLPRDEVIRLARSWADAGATVAISEQEPIAELVSDGWHAVDITATRRGQKRTFSRQQHEWLTVSREPSWTPDVQVPLPW